MSSAIYLIGSKNVRLNVLGKGMAASLRSNVVWQVSPVQERVDVFLAECAPFLQRHKYASAQANASKDCMHSLCNVWKLPNPVSSYSDEAKSGSSVDY